MRLFWKLFFSFWLVVSLVGGGFFWGGHHLRGLLEPLFDAHIEALMHKRSEVANLIVNQGISATRLHMNTTPGFEEILVLDLNHQEILGRPIPGHYHPPRHEREFRPPPPPPPDEGFPEGFRPPPPGPREPSLHRTIHVTDPDGKPYRILFSRQTSPLTLLLREYPFLPVLLIVISGLVVFPLARHFTRPVRLLRGTALRLADGDLTARAPVAHRLVSDELDDLSKDFNFMAERLQSLFHGQKRLLQDVSHELRSPLARMRVALGLIEQEGNGATPEHEEAIHRLTRELERLDGLIGQVLRLSRPEQPEQMPRDTLIDLGALVEQVVEDARFEHGLESPVLLSQLLEPALLWADGEALHSAVENVVRNAMRHAPRDTEVSLLITRSGKSVRILVQDRGPGVPEADLPRITEPFFRVGEARDRASGGHGLGLAIAARAVRDHQGALTARNRRDGGLEVEISLPVAPLPPWDEEPDRGKSAIEPGGASL
ncbi:MAG: HAMP domain-containing protein [Magnetococcales bacterium]|nr:HAMP domain-containing protein [Magnetococcales bacterium]